MMGFGEHQDPKDPSDYVEELLDVLPKVHFIVRENLHECFVNAGTETFIFVAKLLNMTRRSVMQTNCTQYELSKVNVDVTLLKRASCPHVFRPPSVTCSPGYCISITYFYRQNHFHN